MHINDLPDHILEEILSYLTIKEKFRYEIICHHWQRHMYNSVKTLAVDELNYVGNNDDNVFLGQHKHKIYEVNRLSELTNEEVIVKCVISKCGKTLRAFQGYVNYATMVTIVQHCKRLHCIDMHLDDLKSLMLLGEAFGHQLTCVTVHYNMRSGIKSFLSACSNLTSFALLRPRRNVKSPIDVEEPWASNPWSTLTLFDLNSESPVLPKQFSSLRNLVLEDVPGLIRQETLKSLALFTNLEMASLVLRHDLNKSPGWQRVIMNWSGLKCLSLEVTHKYCLHLDPIPPNLEYLVLISRDVSQQPQECDKPIILSNVLPKLKTLKIYQEYMTAEHIRLILNSVVYSCPKLEDFSLACGRGHSGTSDDILAPLLSLRCLKRLSLGEVFKITDVFASNLLTSLSSLTSFGEVTNRSGDPVYSYAVPSGPLFWKALRDKAIFLPSARFSLIGNVVGTLQLESLPTNVSLYPRGSVTIKLINSYGRSKNWLKLVDQWYEIHSLFLEIEESNMELLELPIHPNNVTITCFNSIEAEFMDALTFNSRLPNLKILTIFQQNMSNMQCKATLKSITESCPDLHSLCFDRGNTVDEPIDELVVCLFKCQRLKCLCFSEHFKITDECGANLVTEIQTLSKISCNVCMKCSGFQFGTFFLRALVSKAIEGVYVAVRGGPSLPEVESLIKPMVIPNNFLLW